MRNLDEVIDQMIEVATDTTNLKSQLLKVKRDVFYTAPEVMYMRWNQAHEVLCDFFPDPIATEESINIFSIFTTLSKEELIKAVNDERGRNL